MNVKISDIVSIPKLANTLYLPRLLRNFAANAAVVTCLAAYGSSICAPSIWLFEFNIISKTHRRFWKFLKNFLDLSN